MSLVLRQICVVVADLEKSTAVLRSLFGLEVAYRDPAVTKYGLANAVFPVGSNFIELVSPTRDGTAGGRHLARRGGDAGYMVIIHCDDVPAWKAHVTALNARIVNNPTYEHYSGIHLHPADTGGAILEFNRDVGGDDPWGSYHPAGPDWQKFVRTDVVEAMTGAELQSPDAEKLARRWGELLKVTPQSDGKAWRLPLAAGTLRVVPDSDGRGEGLTGIDLKVKDLPTVLARAQQMGLAVNGNVVTACGMRMRLA
jgi:catechol 2,3-dioxygenase-like lactoylglutathione lyase family enzyme